MCIFPHGPQDGKRIRPDTNVRHSTVGFVFLQEQFVSAKAKELTQEHTPTQNSSALDMHTCRVRDVVVCGVCGFVMP